MRILIMCLLLVGCCNQSSRVHWYCSNHKVNEGKGHLALDEEGRRYNTSLHDCKGWYFIEVIVR